MDKISRRKALQYLISGSAALASSRFLSACQNNPPNGASKPTPGAADTVTPTENQAPTQDEPAIETEPATTPTASTTSTSVTFPDLVVARGGEPDALVRAAILGIGGLERFITKDGWVIVKPNICVAYHPYEYAATTNPWVVGTLVKLCFEAGAKTVQVMDFPFGGSAADAYQISGIAEQVETNGGEMVQMSGFKFKQTAIENALSLTEAAIYEDAFKADLLIDVPIAKNHGMAKLTLGMKNLMGLIQDREEIHWDFGNRLTDLARTIKPRLTLIDAVRILTANGPTGGSLDDVRKLDTVIASTDIVAADSYGATLFGMQPDDLDYVRVGAQTGLGRSDLANLNVMELNVGG